MSAVHWWLPGTVPGCPSVLQDPHTGEPGLVVGCLPCLEYVVAKLTQSSRTVDLEPERSIAEKALGGPS